jgi:hypothetical protein
MFITKELPFRMDSMPKSKFGIYSAVLILLLTPMVMAQDGIIINLETPPCAWGDVHFDQQLGLYLSTVSNVPIIYMDQMDSLPVDFDEFETFPDLIQRSQLLGGRFLIDIIVDRIDIERRKVTVIPLIMFRYRVYALMTGKMRIIDVKNGRLVKMKKIKYEVKAADQWQFSDDDPDDPALHIAADKKMLLFRSLDEKAAKGLFNDIKKITRGAFFGG